jgi:hypothetical protein
MTAFHHGTSHRGELIGERVGRLSQPGSAETRSVVFRMRAIRIT